MIFSELPIGAEFTYFSEPISDKNCLFKKVNESNCVIVGDIQALEVKGIATATVYSVSKLHTILIKADVGGKTREVVMTFDGNIKMTFTRAAQILNILYPLQKIEDPFTIEQIS